MLRLDANTEVLKCCDHLHDAQLRRESFRVCDRPAQVLPRVLTPRFSVRVEKRGAAGNSVFLRLIFQLCETRHNDAHMQAHSFVETVEPVERLRARSINVHTELILTNKA